MILALDIGGANLKVAVKGKEVREFSYYFPFWRRRDGFEDFLEKKIGRFLPVDEARVTMTAELADCYGSRGEGVGHILGCVKNVVPNSKILSVGGRPLSIDEAIAKPGGVAAANWVASSLWIAREFKTGILVDTGSTTTDIIPVRDGGVVARGKTDLERLQNHELVYSGVLRTDVTAIVERVPVNETPTPVSSERFAITADVYGILGHISEEEYACETPDGKSGGFDDCRRRIARIVCSETNELDENDIEGIAGSIKEKQVKSISEAISRVAEREGIGNSFVCGSGAFLGEEAAKRAGISTGRVEISPARALLEL